MSFLWLLFAAFALYVIEAAILQLTDKIVDLQNLVAKVADARKP